MDFGTQAEQYLSEITVAANTAKTYRSLLDSRILPLLGREELAAVGNKAVKLLVSQLSEAGLAPSTINLAVTLVKQVVASATNDEGDSLYPVKWNSKFIKTPEVDPTTQKAPIIPSNAIQKAVETTFGSTKALIALLAGSGLRVNEALAIGFGNQYDLEAGTVTVNGTLVGGQFQPHPKTKAGKRVVDLPYGINVLLKATYPTESARKGTLFPDSEDTYRRAIDALGIPGFHSLRRFRITHLQANSVPSSLIKFWAGHAAGDITEGYTKFGSMVQERKLWVEKAGLGFDLGGV